jgi:hypothetical protein
MNNVITTAIAHEVQDLRGHLHQVADLVGDDLPPHHGAALLLHLAEVNRGLSEEIGRLRAFRATVTESRESQVSRYMPILNDGSPATPPEGNGEAGEGRFAEKGVSDAILCGFWA